MPAKPKDIAANIDRTLGDQVGPNILPALPCEADSASAELDKSDYLKHLREAFAEWASAEDENAFGNL